MKVIEACEMFFLTFLFPILIPRMQVLLSWTMRMRLCTIKQQGRSLTLYQVIHIYWSTIPVRITYPDFDFTWRNYCLAVSVSLGFTLLRCLTNQASSSGCHANIPVPQYSHSIIIMTSQYFKDYFRQK